jgi:hypothetical protein
MLKIECYLCYGLGFNILQMRWQVLRQKAVSIKQDYSDVTSAVSYCHLLLCLIFCS